MRSTTADQPEVLRLFDLDDEAADPRRTSQVETRRTKSPNETRRPSQIATRTEIVSIGDAGAGVLQRVGEAGRMIVEAQRHFDEAIDAARAAGHSWRTIGIEAGIPFQTLHRRRRPGAGDARLGGDS